MPWADYTCEGCPGIVRNHRFDAALGAIASAPICPVCEIVMTYVPAIGRMSAGNGPSFKAFEVAREVVDVNPATGKVERHHRRETIDSIAKLRAVERDSDRRAANGEGEPMRFRVFSQDHSNMDRGSFGPLVPESSVLKKSGRVSVKAVTPSDGSEPVVETGPGMSGSQALAGDE
jgi:hypothetical protein